MTNLSQKIPYYQFFVDSGKFYCDSKVFDAVNIPNNYITMDSDTGNIVDEFKATSLKIKYKEHKVHLGRLVKDLPNMRIERVLIYFPSKVSDNYFYGISKKDYLDVLQHIIDLGYLSGDPNEIIEETYVKDLDIKCDFKFDYNDLPKIKQYNEDLKERYNGYSNEFKIFDSQKLGFGIATGRRETATPTKPFIKFYDKSKEITNKKNEDLLKQMPDDIKKEINEAFIYRFEMTFKDKRFFEKFKMSNRLVDVLNTSQEKWKVCARDFLDVCFETKISEPKDKSKLQRTERSIHQLILRLLKDGYKSGSIKEIFLSGQSRKEDKYQMSILFDRIYYFIENPTEQTEILKAKYENILYFDNLFRFKN